MRSSKVLNNLNGIIGCPEKSPPENCPSPSKLLPQENCPTGKLPPGKMLPKNRFTSLSLLLTLSYNCSFLNSFRGVSCFGFPKFPRESICNGFPRESICNGFPRQKLSKISQFSRASSTVPLRQMWQIRSLVLQCRQN